MPRIARIKSIAGIYHIMVRSISDVDLFKEDEDKNKYLMLIKKYQNIFKFKVYAYCLMTNHSHMIIDCCGADISKIMKSINQCYTAYFNKKYDRHGHLFQDRFKSKLINTDEYLKTVSAYIHNNPADMKKYKNRIHKYKYSSLGVYLQVFSDVFGILDESFILSQYSDNKSKARKLYLEFINNLPTSDAAIDVEFKDEGSKYVDERKILIRNYSPYDIIKFISKYTGSTFNIYIKFNHKNTELKALSILVMRSLCNLTFKEICAIIGNVAISTIWKLCEKGYNLITQNSKYTNLIDDIIKEHSAA